MVYLAFKPEFAIILFDDLFADGQAYACAVVFIFIVQALKHLVDLRSIFFGYADAIV